MLSSIIGTFWEDILLNKISTFFHIDKTKVKNNVLSDKEKELVDNFERAISLDDTNLNDELSKLKDIKNNYVLMEQELFKLKEYDNFRKILNSLRDRNFPYVSYLEGGFEAFHQECLNYNIDLVEHDKSLCKLCIKKKTKNIF